MGTVTPFDKTSDLDALMMTAVSRRSLTGMSSCVHVVSTCVNADSSEN